MYKGHLIDALKKPLRDKPLYKALYRCRFPNIPLFSQYRFGE